MQAKDVLELLGTTVRILLNLIVGSLEPTAGQVVIGETVSSPISLNKLRVWMKAKASDQLLAGSGKRPRPPYALIAELLEQFPSHAPTY